MVSREEMLWSPRSWGAICRTSLISLFVHLATQGSAPIPGGPFFCPSITPGTELSLGHCQSPSLRVIQGLQEPPEEDGNPQDHCSGLPLEQKIGLEKEKPCQGKEDAGALTHRTKSTLEIVIRCESSRGEGREDRHRICTNLKRSPLPLEWVSPSSLI